MTLQNCSKVRRLIQALEKRRWAWLIIVPAWVVVSHLVASLAVGVIFRGLLAVGVPLTASPVLATTVAMAVTWGLTLALLIIVPARLFGHRTMPRDIGIIDRPSWLDVLLPIGAFALYIVVMALVMAVVIAATEIDVEQKQALPFNGSMLNSQLAYVMAFIAVVIVAPVAEELAFRGYLQKKLRDVFPAWLVIVVVGILFGAAHLWGGGGGLQWAVAINTAVLGFFLCALREYTGAIWASMFLHMIKNGVAFYVLFISPVSVTMAAAAMGLG